MAPIAPASWDRNTSAGEFAPSSRIWAASSAESPYRAEILIPVFFSNSSIRSFKQAGTPYGLIVIACQSPQP